MKKYIEPKIILSTFSSEDIIMESVLVSAGDATGYKPTDQGAVFNDTTYVINWSVQE